MSFNCFCAKDEFNVYKIRIQLLDNTISEYTLNKNCTGEECVRKIADVAELSKISYFGLKCRHNGKERWLSLSGNLKKQIEKYKKENEELLLFFKIRFFITQIRWLTEDTTRYFYYLQLRENINDGTLGCTEHEAIVLASYALQVEYGDYDPSEHTEEFINEYQLLPTHLETIKTNVELYSDISRRHEKYIGMSTTDAEYAYIKFARKLKCYGHEFYPAKDGEGRSIDVGPCARGVSFKYDDQTPITYFDWENIMHMTHSKKMFSVETSSSKSVVEMESPNEAKYVWQMCVDHHQFHRMDNENKKKSVPNDISLNQKKRPSYEKRASDIELSNGITKGDEGFVNAGFNESIIENHETNETKRASRESGIYGSSGSQISPVNQSENKPKQATTSHNNNINDVDIPAELLASSYKTFDKTREKKLCHESLDFMARRSYPRSMPTKQNTDNDITGVSRSVSMIVPATSTGDNYVDSCSVQTVATSGYSTSTESGLYNTRNHVNPVSPMSPVSLLSSGSFVYDDYEVPSFDEQCKQLEVVLYGGRLDQQFAQIALKDEKKSTATGNLAINKTKNRHEDILPYEDSRVRLMTNSDLSKSDYINASFIKVKVSKKLYNYIATQAPLKTTVVDFWKMIWEQNVQTIVMLSNMQDASHESHLYWPDDSTGELEKQFGEFEVTTQFINQSSCYKSTGLKLRNTRENKERTIIHLQFLQWPDNGIPSDPSAFLEFLSEVNSIRHNFEDDDNNITPTLVHCCAGIGRTGVFILADLMIAHLQNQTRQPFNVARILSKLRSQRMSLIRTVEQYRFVYNLLIQYLRKSRLI